jgi:hypothetical protein
VIAANQMVSLAERAVGGDINRVNLGARVEMVVIFFNKNEPHKQGSNSESIQKCAHLKVN